MVGRVCVGLALLCAAWGLEQYKDSDDKNKEDCPFLGDALYPDPDLPEREHPPTELELLDDCFEDETMALSGVQGTWYVAFYTQEDCDSECQQPWRDVWHEAATMLQDDVQFAQVDVSAAPRTFERFALPDPTPSAPTVVLLHLGQLYHYTGAWKPIDLVQYAINDFFSAKYRPVPRQTW
mmetsp:Transcript_19449/g.21751  ORF Transcript_19449/g.21751 Transcript_19449/m.21751 type:complete len:180 (+) Transcript_19449:23-562(+)|eukprot:CAMPEP_0205831160 /NCGR_PEP_ID=MMETSP0206-20130828/43244_1 /ASSEMBLY_ACC=CAM_ASM_000279 /TAXON_ID=36767 /ORGANISM="Euplotes focardii, Strain TN1" /LENGTH=179 /DNA_ID=CAMNT_0053135525 /DNA_START=23 /DNA_END=562 /DNA_ORIENTATION=-